MRTNLTISGWLTVLMFSIISLSNSTAHAQGTAFTYQGRLNSNGSPASGSFDFRFKLYADSIGNTQVGASYITNAIPVTTGLFITTIDFGAGIFAGSNYWLEVDVKTNNAGSYTVLSPLQAVTPTPYAIMANSASNLLGTLPAAQLTGSIPVSQLSGTPAAAVNFTGTLNGDVTGSQNATVVSSVGGQSAANIASGAAAANAATSANTANTIVKRDSSGNFSAGTITATAFSGGGTIAWQTVSGTSQQAQPNTGYIVNNSAQVTITLPTSPNVGDIVRISGVGAGGWKVAQNSGQAVLAGNAIALNVGSTWTAHGASTNWGSVACSADGTKIVTIGAHQIYTSADSGLTWTAHGPATNWSSVASSADGNRLVAVVFGGQIYTSTDSGGNWAAYGPSQNWQCIASSVDGSKLVAAVFGGQLYSSTNYGSTWSPYGPVTNWISVASSADGVKFAAAAYGGQIYTSPDAGTTWIPQGGTNNWSGIASSSDGTRLIAVTWPGQIFVSSNSGSNWTPCATSMQWNGIACSADGTKLAAVVQGGQIYTSSDSGATWTARENNRNWWAVSSSADGTKLTAVVSGGQIYTSSPSLPTPNGSTTVGATGYLIGGQGTAIELQYIGNGQFLPLSYAGTIFGY